MIVGTPVLVFPGFHTPVLTNLSFQGSDHVSQMHQRSEPRNLKVCINTFPNCRLKEFADKNFKFYKTGGKFSKRVENTVKRGEIALYEQFLLFSQCFLKTSTSDT